MPLLHSSASVTFATPTLAYIVIADRAVFDAVPGYPEEHEHLWVKTHTLENTHVIWQWYKPTEVEVQRSTTPEEAGQQMKNAMDIAGRFNAVFGANEL